VPKEKIYDAANQFDIEIGWMKDNPDVQIGIGTHDGRSIAAWLAGTDYEPADAALPTFDSLWGNFGRDGINRLIRMLRKARDEAYGKDE
jgi:hypothetical protein